MDDNTQNLWTMSLSAIAALCALANLLWNIIEKCADKQQKKSTEYGKLSSKLEDYTKKQKEYIEYSEEWLGYYQYRHSEEYYNGEIKIDPPEKIEEPSFDPVIKSIEDMEHISTKTRQSLRETSDKIDEIKKSTATCIKEDWADEEQFNNFTIQRAASCAIAACKEAEIARKKAGTDTQSLIDQKKYFEEIIKEQIKIAGKYDYLLIPILRPPSTK